MRRMIISKYEAVVKIHWQYSDAGNRRVEHPLVQIWFQDCWLYRLL